MVKNMPRDGTHWREEEEVMKRKEVSAAKKKPDQLIRW
jgi:hypothetical protein